MDKFMERAVELAVKNVQEGGQPYGAVIVKDGKIVAEGVNTLHKTFDVSGHAELLAIRELQQEIKSDDLSAYTMYASGRPCEMCQTAMYFAGLTDIYYCQTLEEAIEAGFPEDSCMTKEDLEHLQQSMKQLPLDNDMTNPLKLWAHLHLE